VKVRGKVAALAAGALLVGAGTAWAGFVNEPGSPYAVGTEPYSVYAADFNGDGRQDFAAINGTSSDVSVFLRQAGGGFVQEAGSPIPVGAGPGGAVVGDFNGDGRPDLAVTNYQASSVSILLRQPGGGFATEGGAPISIAGGPQSIGTGDFNSDGKLDLVVSLYNSNQVTVLVRNPTNDGFTSSYTNTVGSQPSSIAVADFNGDKLPDFAVVNVNSNSVSVRLRLPAGGFSAEPDVPVGTKPGGIVAADFDRNGRADLAVTNYTSGTVTVLLRDVIHEGFENDTSSPFGVNAGPVGIAAADFDRDGVTDLAVATNGGAINVLRGNPSAAPAEAVSDPPSPGFTPDSTIVLAGAPNGIAAADFDGDGRPDLATSALTTNAVSVLLNPAPPQPPAPTATPTPAVTATPLPPPVAGKTVNVKPVSGKVKFKRPGGKSFVTLTAGAQIPVGSSIDTRAGRITITAAQGKGKTASADFFDGLFKLTQTKGSKPVTTLALTEQLSCPKSGRAAAAAKKKPKTRKLWGDGSGAFSTSGQYSAATVRGTRWLTQDTCTSTLTRVVRGVVAVRDRVKRKTVIVRAGHRYTARAKR
jgi:hypothetical protein